LLGFGGGQDGGVLQGECVVLLAFVRHAWREWGDVPVEVGVALGAAEAEGVHALGRHRRGHRAGYPLHHRLQAEVAGLVEVAHPVFNVPAGRHEAVAAQGWVAVEERDRRTVVVYDVVVVGGVAGDQRADEARALARGRV
jgi:hypothetical protein